jgi:hypothetical protein
MSIRSSALCSPEENWSVDRSAHERRTAGRRNDRGGATCGRGWSRCVWPWGTPSPGLCCPVTSRDSGGRCQYNQADQVDARCYGAKRCGSNLEPCAVTFGSLKFRERARSNSSAVPSAKCCIGSLLEIERAARRTGRRGPGISKARGKTGGRPRTDTAKLKDAKVSV